MMKAPGDSFPYIQTMHMPQSNFHEALTHGTRVTGCLRFMEKQILYDSMETRERESREKNKVKKKETLKYYVRSFPEN